MKKIAVFAFAIALLTTSCKKEEKQETPAEEVQTEVAGLKIVSDSTKVNWVAYKTTAKTPVKGQFHKIELQNTQHGESPEAILEGASFSIPVSSVFTNDASRDEKLKTFFFGALKNTELIGGTFNFRDGKCFLTITLNEVTKQIEVTNSFAANKFTVNAVLNLDDFGAQEAIASLNKVCGILHQGADGVSKTWNEVEINGTVLFK